MWTSVPQMALFRMRMRTSWTPTAGSGASRTSQMPSCGFDFTSAFMRAPRSADHAQRAPHPGERGDGEVQVLAGVGGAHLGADAGLPPGHHREEEAHRVDALLEQAARELLRQRRLAQHHL